jgi:hypothetical protein
MKAPPRRDKDYSSSPKRWQPRPPDGRSVGTASQFVREFLCQNGGSCTVEDLHRAMSNEEKFAEKLLDKGFFGRLLLNLKYGGHIEIDRPLIIATAKTLRRTIATALSPQVGNTASTDASRSQPSEIGSPRGFEQ